MMISLAAAALLNAAAAQPGTFAGGLENLFFSACFDGSVRLAANDAEAVQFDSLPSNLRRKLGAPSEARVWKLRTPGNSYLYMLNFDDRNMSPRVCGLASDNLPIRPAADAIAYRLNASRDVEPQAVTREWWLADQGYMALASRVREYTVLQVNWLSDAQRKEALRNR